MSDEVKPRSLREISARARDAGARPSSPPSSTQDLLSLIPARPSSSPGAPPSAPPGALSGRTSAPPGSLPPVSRPPGSLPPPPGPASGLPPAREPVTSGERASASALATPPPGRDSGKIDLAALSASSRVTMPSEPPSSLGSTTRTTETAAVSASQPTRPVKATEPEKKGSGALIAGVIGVLALIGVGVVVTRAPTPPPQTTTKIAVSAPPVVAEPPPPATTAASAAPAAQPPSDPAAVDINALSGAAEASAKPGFKVGGLLVKAAESAAPAATAVASAAPVVSAAPVPMGSVGALMDEMRKRVGSDGKTEETSQGPSGPAAKQDKPSGGAVLGAIGAVRGAVKACLADVDAVTRIGLVFASDGSVKSVSVSGGAAGKPAEGCVKAAAMKAHVAAFNDDSFSTSFSVRP